MKCSNHKSKNATSTCAICGDPFCADCVIKVGRKNVCKECASEELQDAIKQHKYDAHDRQNITITQQTTQQSRIDHDRKPRGSLFWLIFWLIVFFPIGIIYLLIRRW